LRKAPFNRSNNKFICKQQIAPAATSRSGALRVSWLAFKPLSYKLHDVFDAVVGSLYRLHDGPLHHRLKGDLGVLVPKE
jgi:hypothetical protein